MRRLRSRSISIRRGLFTAVVVLVLSSVCLGYSGGSGEPNDPYHISDMNDLLELAGTVEDYNKCFILTADINMGGQIFTSAIIAVKDVPTDANFTGTFDGDGYKITNFIIESFRYYLGLFGQVGSSGSVKNLGIEDCEIFCYDNDYVGVIVGDNYGSISNCYSTGTVSEGGAYVGGLAGYNNAGSIINCYSASDVNGGGYIGGLVGCNDSGNISDCNSTGNVYGGYYYLGGLVGYNYRGSISNCHSTGDVRGTEDIGGLTGYNDNGIIVGCYSTGNVRGIEFTGGLVGYNSSDSIVNDCYSMGSVRGPYFTGGLVGYNLNGSISNCCSMGNVEGFISAGGLVGSNSGSINNCYSTNTTISHYEGSDAGGLVGYNSGTINNCYSKGLVNGDDIGGLVGGNDGSITHCYSTVDVNGLSDSGGLVGCNSGNIISSYFLLGAGPDNGHGEPLTDGQMKQQESFVGWDFVGEVINGPNDVWDICEGMNYPKLSWQIPPTGDFVCPDGVEINDLTVMCEEWLLEELSSDVWPEGGDGIVNFFDWAVFANQWKITVDYEAIADFADRWLKTGANYYIADIAPAGGDGMVNMLDFAALAENWLAGQ